MKFGEAHNRIVAVPLGRGPHGWYSSSSERDVLDVLADIVANYPVDADRVVMSGASMGGYGAMRMATLYPDLFAGVVQWVGYTGDAGNGTPLRDNGVSSFGALGNAVDLLGSLRHVPMGALYSGADELVHVNQALAVRDRLAALEVPSMFWLHPVASHSTYSVDNTWIKEADWSAALTRVGDVAHVTYRTDRRFFAPDLDIAPDHAYWVSAVVPAGDGYADVDAVSHGCGAGDPVTELTSSTGTDPVPWQGQEVRAVGVNRRPVANRVDLTLANVTSLTIATDRTAGRRPAWDSCLTASSLAYRIDADRPVTVSFSDGRRLALPAGVHEGVLAAALRPSAPVAVLALPATGGRGAALPAVLLLAAALVLRVTTRLLECRLCGSQGARREGATTG